MYITSRCSSISATVLLLLFVQLYAVKQSVVIKKSKLCGNTACDEPLFKSRVKRVMGVNKDPTFLSLLDDSIVDVIAFKFSDRPDIMEGQLQDGSRGFFYAGAIDMAPYVEFLRSSIESKKEMQVISQDVADVGSKRTIGIIHSEMDLVRDYNTKAEAFAAEMHLPAPELLPIPQLSQTGHGHSHDHGHGHSHDHGHGHSHDHGHSHSHENEKDTNQHVQEKVVEPNHNTNPSSVEQKINLPGDSAETLTPTAELPIHNANILKDDVSDTPLSLQTQDENLLINNALVDVDPLLPEHNLSEVDQIELLLARDLLLLQQEQLRQEHHPLVEGVGHEPVGINSVASDTLVAQQTSEALSNVGGQVLQDLPNEPLQTHTLPPAMPEQPQAVPPAMSEQPQAVPAATSEQPQAVPPATSEQPQAVPPATSEQPQAVTEKPPVMPSTVTEQPQAMPSAVTEQPPVIPSVVTEQPQTLPPVETEQPFNGPSTPSTDALPTEAPNVEAVSETSVRTDSIIPTEELTKQSEEAPQGYCDRDDCKTIKQSEPHDAPSQKPASDQFTAKPFEDALGQYSEILDGRSIPEEPPKMSNRASSSVASFIRSALNMDHLSDASIGLLVNIAFVAGSFFLFIASQFLSGFSDSSKFERREFFNLSTRCRELEMAMKNRDAVIDKLQTLGQQRQVDTQSQEEIMRLRHELNSAQQSLALAQTKEAEFDQQFRAAQDSIAEREREVELLKNEVKEYYAKIESASVGNSEINKELEHLKLELNESKTTALEMQQESYSLKEARRHLQQELKSISLDLQKSKTEAEAMEDKVELLTGDLERSKREILSLEELVQQYENEKNQNEESGGSGSGWSDFGEDFNDNERTPEASQSDSKSVASAEKEAKQLRAQLKRRNEEYEEILSLKPQLEQYKQELERFKSLYENEEREREKKSKILTEGSESRLKAIELENETTKKLMEENEAERKNLLKLLTESLKKSSDNDQIVSTLRKDLSTREKDLRELEFESRNKDEKIREIESSLKRLRNEYAKLEVKSFNETKLLKRQLEEVQAPQISSNAFIPMKSRDAFNANTSLDEKRMGGGALSSMAEPIWDEPTTAAAVDFGRNGKDDFYDGMSLPRKTPTRSRRSDRQPMGENSPSDNERQRKEKKDPHRRRSRSQGRQIYAEPLSMPMPYYSGLSSDSSYVSNMMGMGFHPLSGHHSKSGQLHYASSGGSNGGRSPPLEMLRLSDVPPPGVRKPTAGTRMTPGYK